MRVAGLASMYGFGSPLDARLSGVTFQQEDWPWWATAILGWLGMVRAVQQSSWEKADGYRTLLESRLEREPPGFVYKFYRDFCALYEADMAKRK